MDGADWWGGERYVEGKGTTAKVDGGRECRIRRCGGQPLHHIMRRTMSGAVFACYLLLRQPRLRKVPSVCDGG